MKWLGKIKKYANFKYYETKAYNGMQIKFRHCHNNKLEEGEFYQKKNGGFGISFWNGFAGYDNPIGKVYDIKIDQRENKFQSGIVYRVLSRESPEALARGVCQE